MAVNEKEPELQDFGITPEEYYLFAGEYDWGDRGWLCFHLLLFSVPFFVVLLITRDVGSAIINGFIFFGFVLIPSVVLVSLFKPIFVRFKRSRLLASPLSSQIKLYEEAQATYQEAEKVRLKAERIRWEAVWEAERARQEAELARQNAERERLRKLRDYWMNLSGVEFERELAALFQRRGYRVQSTPSSGDQGIDLVARKNGKTTIVQCKRYKSPVGPAIARELYGSLIASRADRAILACTGGFTRGVKEFVKDKPITLIDAWDIIKVEASIQE